VAGPSRRSPLWLPLLQVAAIFVCVATFATVLATAGPTLGYDFRAYLDASRRILDGLPLYDASVDVAGGFAIYLYPPPFAILLIPLALLPGTLGPTLVWAAACIAALVAAIAILPVWPWIRWTLLLLSGLTWQTFMAVKLGQVGPVLLLCFAIAWRCMDRPLPLGASIVAGALVKLQPALLVPWALVTGRWRAAAIAALLFGAICIASLVVVGPAAWADYIALLRRVSDPIPTPRSVSPGAVAYQLGVSPGVASVVQWAYVGAVAAITIHAWFRRDEIASLVVTAVASQVISPIVWDHYAVVLLLPVALVLDRLGPRAWPNVLLPLAGWLPLPWYPVLFAVGLVAAWAVGRPRGDGIGDDARVRGRSAT
jgi:alpha-1,2-mannosyltransferase